MMDCKMETDHKSDNRTIEQMAQDFLDSLNLEQKLDEEYSRLANGPEIGKKEAIATGANSLPIKNLRPQFRSALGFKAQKVVKPTKKSLRINRQRIFKGAYKANKRVRGREERGKANRTLEERIGKKIVHTRYPGNSQRRSAPQRRHTNIPRTNMAVCNETALRLKLLKAQLEARDAEKRAEAAERRELERKAADEAQIAALIEQRAAKATQRATLAEQQLADTHARLNQAYEIIACLEDDIRRTEVQIRSMQISNSRLLRPRPSRNQDYRQDPPHFH